MQVFRIIKTLRKFVVPAVLLISIGVAGGLEQGTISLHVSILYILGEIIVFVICFLPEVLNNEKD